MAKSDPKMVVCCKMEPHGYAYADNAVDRNFMLPGNLSTPASVAMILSRCLSILCIIFFSTWISHLSCKS